MYTMSNILASSHQKFKGGKSPPHSAWTYQAERWRISITMPQMMQRIGHQGERMCARCVPAARLVRLVPKCFGRTWCGGWSTTATNKTNSRCIVAAVFPVPHHAFQVRSTSREKANAQDSAIVLVTQARTRAVIFQAGSCTPPPAPVTTGFKHGVGASVTS